MKTLAFPSLFHEVIQFIIHLRNLIAMIPGFKETDGGRKLFLESAVTETPTPMDLEQCAAEAIHDLQERKMIKYKYDFIWLMQAYNELQPRDSFTSVRDYVQWLRRQKVMDPPSESQLSRYYFPQREKFPNWHFKDRKGKKTTERDRRMELVGSFVKMLQQNAT